MLEELEPIECISASTKFDGAVCGSAGEASVCTECKGPVTAVSE